MARWREQVESRREFAGRLLFEVVIIFIGVTAAFAMEAFRQARSDERYRHDMVAALIPTLDDVVRHNREFTAQMDAQLAAFDAAVARGERPALPIYREQGAERPPTQAWDGIVVTGVSKSLPPDLFFDLSRFYNRQESLGERYVRYAEWTEREIYTLGDDRTALYDPATGRLRPAYAAYVDRLRELKGLTRELGQQAATLKTRLAHVARETQS